MTHWIVMAAQESSSDSTDVVARIIAIWGAVVATLLLLLQVVKLRRERSRLKVWAGTQVRVDGSAIVITVVNPPLAPAVTIMEAGLMATENDTISLANEDGERKDSREDLVRHVLLFHENDPILIAEGETKVFKIDLDGMPFALPDDGDLDLRAFVRDAEGRLIRGNRRPFFKDAVVSGWKPLPRKAGQRFQTSSLLLLPDGRFKRLRWERKHR